MDRCNEIEILKNRSEGDIKMTRETDQNENPFWVFAERKTGEYPDSTPDSGKWLVFVKNEQAEEFWEKIKKAVEEGRLGSAAKMSTGNPDTPFYDPNRRVICVYTYDWTDTEDVMRIREELRKLGVTWKIPYKTDEDTFSGKYVQTGHKRISKYYI